MTPVDKALYDRWMALWNGDSTLASQIIAPDCVVHQAGQPDRIGPRGVLEMIEMGRAPFSDIGFSVELGPIVDGNWLSARWRSRGVYQGGIPGATAPAGTVIDFGGMDIMRVENGQIAEYWVSSDGLHLMQQLGVS